MIFLARKNPSLWQTSGSTPSWAVGKYGCFPELRLSLQRRGETLRRCGRGWWAGVSSWKGEAPAGRRAVVQEGSSGCRRPREDVPSWPSSILKQPRGSHFGVAACGSTWAVTASQIQGSSTDWSQIWGSEMPSCIIYIPWQNISQTNLTGR